MSDKTPTKSEKSDKPSEKSAKPSEKSAKIEVLSERKLADGSVVRVLTNGRRVWKDAPEASGMGPLS